MTNKANLNIPAILNMADFVLIGKTYEDNHIASDIKGKYRLKITLDDLNPPMDDSEYSKSTKQVVHVENQNEGVQLVCLDIVI